MINELLNKYRDYKKEISEYRYAIFIISFDQSTDCPLNDKERASECLNYFENKIYSIILSEEYIKLIYNLYSHKDELDEVTKLDIEIEYKDLEKTKKIPRDELEKHIENMTRSYVEWEKARESLDYSSFIKELDENISYNKKYIKWQETDLIKGYDVLLDDMEEGYNTKMYDEFFDLIEKELVPYIKDILKRKQKYNPILDNLKFDIDKQKKLTEIIAKQMEYDNSVGCIRTTPHPFTNWANHNDVRITTSYDESLLFSNLYSVMHEIGHALFQIHMDKKYDDTNIFDNVSCITHESQSRFYENYLGRRRSFVKFLYPILKETFNTELKDITEDDIYYYINSVKAQFIRCDADELTYPIHVLIRYKVEKDIFINNIKTEDIGTKFNEYMNEYLGITPSNMKEGCYQDVHWSSGFGYFPTYAVGSAYGIMFLDEMTNDIDVDKDLSEGNFKNINIWLTEKIHKYSGTRKNLEVVRSVTNKEFDPHRYIEYLKNKFDEIYK